MISQTKYGSVIVTQNQTSDEGLIHACRAGESEAWNTLVNRYQRLIYTIPRRAGLDEDYAAEVFQSTFAKLLENLDRIRQPENIRAWLVTTARRETLQVLREQKSEQPLSDTDSMDSRPYSEMIADDKLLPNETIERLEEQHLIRTAVTALEERCRQLLTLLYYRADPPSYAEVAATLDMPEGSLGPTRARCLEKLRRLLEQADF